MLSFKNQSITPPLLFYNIILYYGDVSYKVKLFYISFVK